MKCNGQSYTSKAQGWTGKRQKVDAMFHFINTAWCSQHISKYEQYDWMMYI